MNRLFPLLLLLFPTLLLAAAQDPEKLRIDGKEEPLMATPLESHWSVACPRPKSLTQTSWTCWRGYVGTWEISGNHLYLVQLERHEIKPKDSNYEERVINLPVQKLFGNPGPVSATWFTGVLRVVRGRILTPVNTGYASVYEEDLFLIVDHGQITSQRSVKNTLASLTSESDLAWRELGRIDNNGGIVAMLPEDNLALEKGTWLSQLELILRTRELEKDQTTFEIRGVYLPGKLWFPRLTGAEATFTLDVLDQNNLPAPGAAISATCTLVATKTGPRLVASAISELPPGNAIQRRWSPRQKKPNLQESIHIAADTPDSSSSP